MQIIDKQLTLTCYFTNDVY